MEYGLIGMPLGHSYSREIHEQIADYRYELCEVTREQAADLLTKREFRAINVTIPYKEFVIPFLDEISEEARAIGAVNTIVNRGGRLIGHNTDFAGLRELVLRCPADLSGKKALILGTGGTAKTARAVLTSLGCEPVITVSRTGREGAITYEEALRDHTDAAFLLNATPVGMYPHNDGMPVDPAAFPELLGVIDVIYNPLRTRLVQQARACGVFAEGGLLMLAAQAVYAAEWFLDEAFGPEKERALIDKAYRHVAALRGNLVLTGMPGSGKSTVGRLLAEALGHPFVDLDEEIVKETGMPIADFFAAHGEAAFRDMEAAVCVREAKEPGRVIATGGGTILREENVRALRQNGTLIFLDRPLAELVGTPDRPLSRDAGALKKRCEERYERYCETADIRVDVCGDAESAAQAVLRAVREGS